MNLLSPLPLSARSMSVLLPSSSTATLAHSNSYTQLKSPSSDKLEGSAAISKNASVSSAAETKQLHLHANAMRRALRATSSYDQARSAPEGRPPAYSWPCTALCIIPAVPAERAAPPAVPQSASVISAPVASSTPAHQPYDLLLLGTHVHASAREQAAESGRKSCIFVAVLPHVPPSAQAREPAPHAHPLFRAPSLRARHGGGANGSQGPHANRVRVIPSYGEFAAPPASRFASLNDAVRGWAQRLCGKPTRSSRREKSYACTTFFSKLWKGVRRPLHAVESWWNRDDGSSYLQSSGNDATRLLRHYPRLSSLAENGVSLVEEAWPWTGAASGGAAAPFFGLELVWAESDAEWRAREFGSKAAPFARGASIDDPAAPRRELPIHPSHLCLDPKSGEILLTDHDKHAVFKILPSWIMMQELMHIAEPKHGVSPHTISAFDASALADAEDCAAAAAAAEDFVLPLPDVLLDLVVGYLGNQVWLLAGETNIKGCRDGSGSDARFNAPNGVAIHPRTGQVFVTDGHWNSRICSLQPQITTQTTVTTKVSSNGNGDVEASASTAMNPSPAPARWNVATVPLLDAGSGSSLSTWWSAVKHSRLYARAPALWPLRLPTAPVVLPGAAMPAAAAGGSYSSDALVLLDEELHILRHIPLASGEISTISGQAGSQGMQDGWAQSAQFLFPQALISLPHPLGGGNAAGGAAKVPPRNCSMAARQALLLADTGNDRLCLVNLVSRAEIRQERRKQSMLRRQMRALHRSISSQRRRSSSGHSTPDQSDNEGDANGGGAASSTEEDDDSSSDESDTDSSAPGAPRDDTGPLVGHVETVRLRGQLPPEYDENFIRAPWSPWSDLRAAAAAANAAVEAESTARSVPVPASSAVAASSMTVPASSLLPVPMPAGTLKQHELAASRYASSAATQATYDLSSAVAAASASSSSSSSSNSSSSSPPTAESDSSSSSSPSSPPAAASSSAAIVPAAAPSPLTPLPFVHRGQNTFIRKLVVTSQGKIIALNRLGLQVWSWNKDASMDE